MIREQKKQIRGKTQRKKHKKHIQRLRYTYRKPIQTKLETIVFFLNLKKENPSKL